MFGDPVASAGTEYMVGALYAEVSTNASKPLGAVSIGAQESEAPRRAGRAVSLLCSTADI